MANADPEISGDVLERSMIVPRSFTAAMSPDVLEPVTSLRQVLENGAATCFVVPVDTRDPAALERTIQSVVRQSAPNWEVLLAPADGFEAVLDEWLEIDWRIRRLPEPPDGRPDLVRAALYATSDFIGTITQGDLVEDELVASISRYSQAHPRADIIYTDEARIGEDSRLKDHFYKPDWSPEHLHSTNYVGRFTAFRKSKLLMTRVAPAVSVELQDYALLLKLAYSADEIIHIDEVLYLRAGEGGRPIGGFFGEGAMAEAGKLLHAHVQEEDQRATVTQGKVSGAFEVNWPVGEVPVTLVILTGMRTRDVPGRGNITLATHFVRSIIERSSFPNYRILLVDDGEVPDDLRTLLVRHGHDHHSYISEGAFSFAHKANFGVGLVDQGVAILLNDDMEVIEPDWIQAMAGLALRPGIGVVGGRLLYADDSIQHAGVVLGYSGATGHILHRAPADGGEYGGFASITRNFSAVTGAAMAMRKSIFDSLGGFDERFCVDYNDIDFCLRLRGAGYRVALTPAASLYHFHNSSLKRRHDDEFERRMFVERWGSSIARDPYYSQYFQRRRDDQPLLFSDVEPTDDT
ncbi:MAG TPA: glycosyltransferase [Caulobacteraceae bacterium]|nr:glycosyltransferase [Caulobacteraceae bacterium]